jgi:hypothetical protein
MEINSDMSFPHRKLSYAPISSAAALVMVFFSAGLQADIPRLPDGRPDFQ